MGPDGFRGHALVQISQDGRQGLCAQLQRVRISVLTGAQWSDFHNVITSGGIRCALAQ